MDNNFLLDVQSLKTYFYHQQGIIKASDDVSFNIKRGETLGVVGESGCGKSVTAKSIIQLLPQKTARIESGVINYNRDGEIIDLIKLEAEGEAMRSIRGNEIAMVFQEPMTSLTPVYTVGIQIMEALRLHQNLDKAQARERAIEMLELVGIAAPETTVDDYPFELSGGMRQRVMIAMALSCDPDLLIADEPTTALDVTIEAQILELMQDLQNRLDMSIMIITHDLGVIGEMAERVIVMYMGKIVEKGTYRDIFYKPQHPYTKGLLTSIPVIGRKQRLQSIAGSVPNPYFLPDGCSFAPRCNQAMDICSRQEPPMIDISENVSVKCWLYEEGGELKDDNQK